MAPVIFAFWEALGKGDQEESLLRKKKALGIGSNVNQPEYSFKMSRKNIEMS